MIEVICEWCDSRTAEYELAIYTLKEMETFKRSQHVDSPTMLEYKTLGRGPRYCSIKLCEQCLPTTKIMEHTVAEPQTTRVIRKPLDPKK